MTQFYVYIHSRPDGMPFYVGKGSGKRAYDFHNGRNPHHKYIVKKYGRENIGVLVLNFDSESEAFEKEIEYISVFRQAGIKLANICDGGEGISGIKRSEETKAKISKAHLNRTPEHKARLIEARKYHPPMTDEAKAKISAAAKARAFNPMLGKKHSPEAIAKMSAARKKDKDKPRDENGRFA